MKKELKSLYATLASKHGKQCPDASEIAKVLLASGKSLKFVEQVCQTVGICLNEDTIKQVIMHQRDAKRVKLSAGVVCR
jgi:hypothetical protein